MVKERKYKIRSVHLPVPLLDEIEDLRIAEGFGVAEAPGYLVELIKLGLKIKKAKRKNG